MSAGAPGQRTASRRRTTPGTNATLAKRIRLQPMALGRNTAQKICQKVFPARNVLWHRKQQLPNSLRRVDAMWLWARPDVCYGGWDYCCFHQHLFCGRNARIQLVSATAGFGSACFDCSLAISSSHTSLGVLYPRSFMGVSLISPTIASSSSCVRSSKLVPLGR